MKYTLDNLSVRLIGDNHYIADTAAVIGDVTLEDEVSVWFGAVIRGDNDSIHIGAGTNVQDCAVIHTDEGTKVTIGRRVTIGHHVMLHGCEIGDFSLIGINAVILDDARIGKNCLIGANAMVTSGKEIPDGSLVLGSPGKVVRNVTPEEIEDQRVKNQIYIDKVYRYNKSLRADP